MFKPATFALLAIALVGSQLAPTSAADADSLRQACMADFHKFCSGARAVLGPMKCMRQHAAELSDACKSAWLAKQKSKPDPSAGKSQDTAG